MARRTSRRLRQNLERNGQYTVKYCSIVTLLVQDVVRTIEKNPTGAQDRPKKEVLVADSRHEAVAEPFAVAKEPVKE